MTPKHKLTTTNTTSAPKAPASDSLIYRWRCVHCNHNNVTIVTSDVYGRQGIEFLVPKWKSERCGFCYQNAGWNCLLLEIKLLEGNEELINDAEEGGDPMDMS